MALQIPPASASSKQLVTLGHATQAPAPLVLSQKSDIILLTFNAKYHHTAFGLRYLYANLGPYQNFARIEERTIHDDPALVVEWLLSQSPKMVGFSVYIWNREITLKTINLLKRLSPDISILVGGPEVSYEYEALEQNININHIFCGEGEQSFFDFIDARVKGHPVSKIYSEIKPDIATMRLPYALYDARDIEQRAIYVEASRGCPYECSFCLSSLEEKVRNIPLQDFFEEMQKLYDRGARQFKFIDRTFNLKPSISTAILDFFFERYTDDMFLHFEVVPDRLPDKLKERIARFPKAALQFEIGIQSLTLHVMSAIHRRQNLDKTRTNFGYLTKETGAYIHADLIAGLPGQTIEDFERSFNQLYGMGPHEIQMGILKRLKGSPIIKLSDEFDLRFDPSPPYSILSSSTMSFSVLQKVKRMAKTWDQIVNQQQFPNTTRLLFKDTISPFQRLKRFDDVLHQKVPDAYPRHSVNLQKLAEILFDFTCEVTPHNSLTVLKALMTDFRVIVDRPQPKFIGQRPELVDMLSHINLPEVHNRERYRHIPDRQRRWAIDQDLTNNV